MDWTGHFLVDYGLATVCAWAGEEAVTDSALRHAYDQMRLQLQSNERFYRKLAHRLIPNSPFTQPGSDLAQCLAMLDSLYQQAVQSLQPGPEICHICGRRVPEQAISAARKHLFPLLSGMFNFYLELQDGMSVCGLCRFAVLTLLFTQPTARVLVPDSKRKRRQDVFLIPHVQHLPWLSYHVHQSTAETRGLSAAPDSRRIASTLQPERLTLGVLAELYSNTRHMLPRGVPFTVWMFNAHNISTDTYLRYYTIPHPVVEWAQRLIDLVMFRYPRPGPPVPFLQENTIHQVAPLLDGRYVPPRPVRQDGELVLPRDRWYAVRRFLTEVEMLDPSIPASIHEIVVGLVGTDIQLGKQLQKELFAPDARALQQFRKRLLDAVRQGKVSDHAAGLFLTFEPFRAIGYLRVCLNDYVCWLEEGSPYPFDLNVSPVSNKTELQGLVEQVAQRIATHHHAKHLYRQLLRAQGMKQLRHFYVRLAQRGLLEWSEFVQLYEPDFVGSADAVRQAVLHNLAMKDYLLVCLASLLGAQAVTEDDEEVSDEADL